MKKILFIINPFSGIGKQKKIEKLIKAHLDESKFLPDVKYTEYAGHAIKISKNAADKYDIIVAVGGDGSVNEVSRGLINTGTVLAVVPAGSGNGFARHLKLPLNPEKALKVINNLKIKTIDTAQINEIPFVNVAGTGFDAEMGYKFAKLKKRGFFGYTKAVFTSFDKFKGKTFEIIINNIKIKDKFFLITFANGSQYGLNARISPESEVNDALAEVVTVKHFPFIAIPFLALKLFTGKINNSKYVKTYKTDKLKIRNKKDIIIHTDGEPVIMNGEIKIKLISDSLKIIVP